MKCEVNGTVNIKLQVGGTFKLNDVLYIPQAANNILSVLRIVSKIFTMRSTKDNMTIKKNSISKTPDARKVKNYITLFYLKANRYAPEGFSPQEVNRNLTEETEVQDDEKNVKLAQ